MTNKQLQRYEIGMVGLGVMGRNLLLNMADHGYSVAGYDQDQAKVEALQKESTEQNIVGETNLIELVPKLLLGNAVAEALASRTQVAISRLRI